MATIRIKKSDLQEVIKEALAENTAWEQATEIDRAVERAAGAAMGRIVDDFGEGVFGYGVDAAEVRTNIFDFIRQIVRDAVDNPRV